MGLAELGLDPRCVVTVRAPRCRERAAHDGRCAGLRCARRGRAGGLGRGQAARSRRQPQADSGGTSLRRHRAVAAACSDACAIDRGKPMDRARGAFAAISGVGRAALRRTSLSAIVMARPGDGSWNGNVMRAFSARRRILCLWLPRLPIDRIRRELCFGERSDGAARVKITLATRTVQLPPPLAGEGWGGGVSTRDVVRAERISPTRIASQDAMRPPPQAGEVKRASGAR